MTSLRAEPNLNPHNVPMERVVWLKTTLRWENPLKAVVGLSDQWRSLDGRSFVCIAELYNPQKCTLICHPDNFHPMENIAKRIALGMVKREEQG